jgi:hypothetical protein
MLRINKKVSVYNKRGGKMKKKSLKITLSLIASLALFLMLGTACTSELNADPLEEGEYPPFVERLAERFDLDKDEVMDFLEELREERKAEMEARFEEKLDELVQDGEITSAQKEAILEKKEELEAFKEGLGDMTVSDAKGALKDLKEELKDWAEENDIEFKYLFTKAALKKGPRGIFIFRSGCRR